jgi:serine/threonine protein kinase
MGTPGFAAPEHYGNQQTDVRSDIYGLAATLHYLVTGRDPADSPFRFQPPYILNPGVSKWFSDILMVSLEPRPEDRFSNAMEMLEAMEGPRGVAIKAKEYHYPEKLTLFPRKDRPLQIFAGLTAVTGIGLTVLTGFVPFSMGAGWIAGMALNNRIRNHMKSQTAFISTPRELMIKYRHKVDQIPWENIQVVKVVKYQSMMRSKRTQDDQAHDDTIRVGTVEIFYVKGSGHMAHNFLSKFPADYLYSFKGLWMEKVHFTSEMQSWEELLKTILTRGKLKSTGTPGNPLADEVYIR